jgi:hypothetical protein
MPFDAVLLSLAVSIVFIGFAGALAWADHQSQSRSAQADAPAQKRRSF